MSHERVSFTTMFAAACGAVLCCLVFAVSMRAQSQPPVLTELQQTRMQLFDARAETVMARYQQALADVQALQAEIAAYTTPLKRDGWKLERGEGGVWQYVVDVPEPEPVSVPQPETPQ